MQDTRDCVIYREMQLILFFFPSSLSTFSTRGCCLTHQFYQEINYGFLLHVCTKETHLTPVVQSTFCNFNLMFVVITMPYL